MPLLWRGNKTKQANAHALFFGYTLPQTLAWIATGLPFDLLHGVGNLAAGILIVPMRDLLVRLEKM